MNQNNIGFSLYYFQKTAPLFMIFLKNAVNTLENINITKIELPVGEEFGTKDSIAVNRILKSSMSCYSIHFSKTVSISELLKKDIFLEAIDQLSPKIIVIHPEEDPFFFQHVDELSKRFQNTIVTIEYLPYQPMIKDKLDHMEEKYMVTFDVYHCINTGLNWREMISFFGDRIKHVHVRGLQNPSIEDVFNELSKINYKGTIMIEGRGMDGEDCLKDFSYLYERGKET